MSERSIHRRLKLAHWTAELFDSRLPYFKGARQIRNGLTRFLAPPLDPPYKISTRYGFDIVITTANDSIDHDLLVQGTYEAGTLNIIGKCLRKGDIFLDIGANIGLMSLLGAVRVEDAGIVYAFEPEPDTFKLLKHNIAINHGRNIRAMNCGLGATQGIEQIYRNCYGNRGMASFIERGVGAVKGTQVPVWPLDTFLAENDISAVRMMKIDVEGWELEVLKGAQRLLSQPEAPILCVEYNSKVPGYKEMYELIMTINAYRAFMLPHGNWHASRLMQVKSANDLPDMGSFNIYFFLPVHRQSLPTDLFKDE